MHTEMSTKYLVNLAAKPFYLKDRDIEWVESTLAAMSLEEKVGQLFCLEGEEHDEAHLDALLEQMNPGGVMYRPGPAMKYQSTHRYLQANSRIPSTNCSEFGSGRQRHCEGRHLLRQTDGNRRDR